MLGIHRVVLFLVAMAAVGQAAQPCQQSSYVSEKPQKLPAFAPQEFAVDVEMSRLEADSVTQVKMIYSESQNTMKMSMLSAGQKTDIFYIPNEGDGEIVKISYNDNGRGTCSVTTFAEEEHTTLFFVGGSKKGKLNGPLGLLRMAGPSGFGGEDQIQLQQIANPQPVRDMEVDGFQSCQKWTSGDQKSSMVLKVEHYFTKADTVWQTPYGKPQPLLIKIKGSGTYQGFAIDNFEHYYSFFQFRGYIDESELEIPAGVYCEGRKSYPFPPVPEMIQFTAEVVDNTRGTSYYMEELFNVIGKFAMMKIDGQTIFREYTSGLSFTIRDNTMTCSTNNITTSSMKLPFDFAADGGIARQLSADQFFYKGDNKYEYMGQRTVRGIKTTSYVTRAPLLNSNTIATIEWYFADHKGTFSWNDNVPAYKTKGLSMPVLFRAWPDDESTDSLDVSFFQVDFSQMTFGTIDLRTCFQDTRANHFQLILTGSSESIINTNLEMFKWTALHDIETATQVQWWRIADFTLYFNTNDAVIEFEILGVPPHVSDVVPPPVYVTVDQAADNLKKALADDTFTIHVWDQNTGKMSKPVKTTLGVIV